MTVELVLLVGIYAFIVLGAFLGDLGPVAVFKQSGPRLAARVERNVSTADGFRTSNADGKPISWEAPQGSGAPSTGSNQ